MILPLAFLIGGFVGWRRATKRGGNRLDKLQFGAAHGLAFMLTALILTIIYGHLAN